MAILALLISDSIAFLTLFSINSDDIDTLPPVKRMLVKIGQLMVFLAVIVLFPISLLWFLIYVNFMIHGDMS